MVAVKRIIAIRPNATIVEVKKELADRGMNFDIKYVSKLVKKIAQERIHRAKYNPMTRNKVIEGFVAFMDELNIETLDNALNRNIAPKIRLQFIREARIQWEHKFWMLMKSGYLESVSALDETKARENYQVPLAVLD